MLRFLALALGTFLLFPGYSIARDNSSSSTVLNETYHIGVFSGTIDNGGEYGENTADGFVLMARNSKMSLEYINFSSDDADLNTGGTWNTSGAAIYLGLLGQGNPYMKFKIGSVQQETIKTVGGVDEIIDDSVTSYGLGFGYRFGSQGIIEVEVVSLDNEASFVMLSILY